jgi:hypothetical protein
MSTQQKNPVGVNKKKVFANASRGVIKKGR